MFGSARTLEASVSSTTKRAVRLWAAVVTLVTLATLVEHDVCGYARRGGCARRGLLRSDCAWPCSMIVGSGSRGWMAMQEICSAKMRNGLSVLMVREGLA